MTNDTPASATSASYLDAALSALRQRTQGEVILPGDSAYDEGRQILGAGFDRRPAVVVRPANAADVITAVNFARENGLDVAVKSGGHSPAGLSTCDDGLVIDFSSMKAIELSPDASTVRIEPGALWGEVAQALHPHGLAISSGDFGSVGVGGLTTGGGIGWMVRKVGLTVDHLLAADVVLADGTMVRASADENQDLFWAIRGGGGNFGVVTSFLFSPHEAGMVTGGAIVYDGADLARVLRGFADYCVTAPDELTVMVDIMHAPPLPFLPPEKYGALIAMVTVCCATDPERAQEIVAPLRQLGTPIADIVGPMPYPAMYAFTDHALPPEPYFAIRSSFLDEMNDDLINSIVDATAALPMGHSLFQFRAFGGEMSRKPADSVAFSHRDKSFLALLATVWVDPSQSAEHQEYTADVWQKLAPHARGAYVGFLGNEGEERKRSAYTEESYRRLAEIKARYDPTNLFHLNQNVEPAPTPGA